MGVAICLLPQPVLIAKPSVVFPALMPWRILSVSPGFRDRKDRKGKRKVKALDVDRSVE